MMTASDPEAFIHGHGEPRTARQVRLATNLDGTGRQHWPMGLADAAIQSAHGSN